MTKKSNKSTVPAAVMRPIDMVPKQPLRHTLRIEEADNGGYTVRHEISKNGSYNEKLHIAADKAALHKIIGKAL